MKLKCNRGYAWLDVKADQLVSTSGLLKGDAQSI